MHSATEAALFQFLIGTIQTQSGQLFEMLIFRFQFLIGTIQTIWANRDKLVRELVSIPHRYDPNEKALAQGRAIEARFQFLIGTIQTDRALVLFQQVLGSFNSS